MVTLKQAAGAELEQMVLSMMIEHHRGAIEMARIQLAEGKHRGAKQLAREIIDTQQREVGVMERLLRR
jgi:uncharacterized protein (DUF305 family)